MADAGWQSPRRGWSLQFSLRPHWLEVRIDGEAGSADERLQCWRELLGQALRQRAEGLLVIDARHGETLSVAQLDDGLRSLARERLARLPVAYVGRLERFDALEPLGLWMLEQGYTVAVCASETDAERWLRYGEWRDHGPDA